MTQSWKSQHERSTPFALKSIRWIALHLGRPTARGLLYPITLYFLLFAPAQRKASRNYLKRVLNREPSWLDLGRHIFYFASTILDRVYLMTGQFNRLAIQFPDENIPLRYAQQGFGSILLGSHVGSYEVLRSYAVNKCPLPIKILMYEQHNPMIAEVLNALNPALSSMMIPLNSVDSMLKVKDAVEQGIAVGLLGDRVLENRPRKKVRCRILGGEVDLPSAPILIAASLKVPIIVFFGLYRGGNRYELRFEVLAEKIELDQSRRQQDLQQWMQKYADILERTIKSAPYNWFNFYDYWQEE
ncbi:MAG: acyl-CoA synthetase [Methylococcales bacterium]